MRMLSKLLALLLAYGVGIQPTVASAQSVQMQAGAAQVGVPYVPGGAFSSMQVPGALSSGLQAPGLSVGMNGVLPTLSAPKSAPAAASVSGVSPSAVSPAVARSVSPKSAPAAASVSQISPSAVSPAVAQAVSPAVSLSLSESHIVLAANAASPASRLFLPAQARAAASKKLSGISAAVSEAGKGISSVSGVSAHEAAGRQFRALIGEKGRSAAAAEPVEVSGRAAALPAESKLQPASEAGASEAKAEVPEAAAEAAEPKAPFTQVFKDPVRNKAFWRYTLGYTLAMFGYEMYMTALPFLISSFTKNTLKENNDLRLANADALKTLVRENRSFARIAHYAAQAVSYFSIPLFGEATGENSKKWLVRAALTRSAIIVLIPTLFFASGLFSLQAAVWTLFGLIALQSFVQGVSVIMDSAVTAKITGDKSVTDSERIKANSIFTLVWAITAIIGPAIAGQISQIGDLFGKTGVGSAILYGLYGLFIGLSGLLFATIRLMAVKAKKAADAVASADGDAAAAKAKPAGVKGVLKGLWESMREGTSLIMKNRFLRTMMLLTLIISMFSDPLIFNVLPEYVESVLTANPNTLGWIMNIPVVGWVLKGMTSTPTGYFSLLVVFSSLGSILSSLLISPVRKLLGRLGFKSEESLVMPFYFLAALEAPLFWIMLSAPSALAIVSLYGLQTFVTSFASMILSGLHQKSMGSSYSPEQMNKILAAESMIGIIATIASTYLYGFILGDIPIATSMLIAAVAMTVLAAFRIVAPWLYFSKEERSREKKSAPAAN